MRVIYFSLSPFWHPSNSVVSFPVTPYMTGALKCCTVRNPSLSVVLEKKKIMLFLPVEQGWAGGNGREVIASLKWEGLCELQEGAGGRRSWKVGFRGKTGRGREEWGGGLGEADLLEKGTKHPSVSSPNTPFPALLIQKGNICLHNCWATPRPSSPAHLFILSLRTSLAFIWAQQPVKSVSHVWQAAAWQSVEYKKYCPVHSVTDENRIHGQDSSS